MLFNQGYALKIRGIGAQRKQVQQCLIIKMYERRLSRGQQDATKTGRKRGGLIIN